MTDRPPASSDGPIWHAADDVLVQFARAPESLDALVGSSVELHVASCARCRAVVAGGADAAALDASWASIADRIDAPRRTVIEQALGTLALTDATARVVAATPALRGSWFVSVAVLVATVVAVARELADPAAYLVVAPLVPLAAVAACFWPEGDPAGEIGSAAPMAGFALAIRRTLAVLVPTVAVLAAGSLAAPDLEPLDVAWLLPAIALCTTTLALGTWMRADHAAGVLASAWLVAIAVLRVATDGPAHDLAPFTPPARAAWLAILGAAGGITFLRRDEFAFSRRTP